MSKHRHYAAAMAYADGDLLESRPIGGEWVLDPAPTFSIIREYRVRIRHPPPMVDVLRAWAHGRPIQQWSGSAAQGAWLNTRHSPTDPNRKYRVAPEIYRRGDRIIRLGEECVIAQVDPGVYILLSLPRSDSCAAPLRVEDPKAISHEELTKMADGSGFCRAD